MMIRFPLKFDIPTQRKRRKHYLQPTKLELFKGFASALVLVFFILVCWFLAGGF